MWVRRREEGANLGHLEQISRALFPGYLTVVLRTYTSLVDRPGFLVAVLLAALGFTPITPFCRCYSEVLCYSPERVKLLP